MLDVGRLEGAVDDGGELFGAAPRDYEVVDDPACFVCQNRVALTPLSDADDRRWHQLLERLVDARAIEIDDAHVADIEQRRARTRVLVLGDDAGFVLNSHLVAGKGNETSAVRLV